MGNVCGKYLCCVPVENNGKQYQPETEDGKVNIVTNQGSTVDTNSQPSTSNSSTAKNGEMNKIGNEEKKKKAKKKKNDSSSSDSDDSDDYIGKAFKGLNGRGPTIYNVRGSVHSYEHCNVNIGGTHTTIHKTQAPPAPVTTKPEKTEKRPVFDSFYTEDSAIEEETRQWKSVEPAGCFYDTRDMGAKKYVSDLQATMDMQSSVGMIIFQGFRCGTCFRVGPKHIMLPVHIIQSIINDVFDRELGEDQKTYRDLFSPTTLNQPTETAQRYLQILNNEVYIVFSYLIEQQGGFNESDKFYLKEFSNGIADVPFFDTKTDSMVLELREDSATRSDLPPAFKFSIPKLDEGFTFISHSGGERKQIDDVKQFVNPEDPKTIADLNYIRGESDRFLRSKNMDVAKYRFDTVGPGGFNRIENPARYLFHTKCSKGGSGSPGVVVLRNNTVAVVTMLVCGYPDWKYKRECEKLSKWPLEHCIEQGSNMVASRDEKWPLEHCIEQGSNMVAIRDEMIQQNKTQLANEIFPKIFDMNSAPARP